MQVTEVHDKRGHSNFMGLPSFLYRNDPNWIPHLKQDLDKVFDPGKNKLLSTGKLKRWIIQNEIGLTIGRIAAFVNTKYSAGMEQPTGGLGFFECINEVEVSQLLFQTAVDWLKSEGMEAVDGPINFGEKNMFWGLLTDNFTDANSYGMNYNPSYYQALFEDFGFKLYYEQYCYKRDMNVPAQQVFVDKADRLRADPKFRVTNIRGKHHSDVARDFLTVYNNSWGGHHGFKSMKLGQAKKIIKALKPVIDPDIVIFAYYGSQPIAFYINIPELNEIFVHVNGNLNWIGKLKFLYHKWKRTSKTMVGIVFGVDRSFHGRGVEGALIKWSEENIVPLGRYPETVLTWIGDFNPKMIKIAKNLGAAQYRTLTTYRYLFDREVEYHRAPMAD